MALVLMAAPALAQSNLLTNSGFATSLDGWGTTNVVTTNTWLNFDASGTPGSGSASVVNSTAGLSEGGISQCVALKPGAAYRAGGKAFVPTGQAAPAAA